MVETGFDLGSSLTFLLALNLGAVAGSLLTAWAGTRVGPLTTAVTAAALAALGLAVLLLHPGPYGAYGALVLAGVGTHGTQCLIIAAIADHYPARLRGTALGFSLGFRPDRRRTRTTDGRMAAGSGSRRRLQLPCLLRSRRGSGRPVVRLPAYVPLVGRPPSP